LKTSRSLWRLIACTSVRMSRSDSGRVRRAGRLDERWPRERHSRALPPAERAGRGSRRQGRHRCRRPRGP
jgi:hypothetical protein